MRVNRINGPKDRQFQPPIQMAMRHCGSPSTSKRSLTEDRSGEPQPIGRRRADGADRVTASDTRDQFTGWRNRRMTIRPLRRRHAVPALDVAGLRGAQIRRQSPRCVRLRRCGGYAGGEHGYRLNFRGNGPTTSTPGWPINSLSCWKPRSASPRETTRHWHARRGDQGAAQHGIGDAPFLAQGLQVIAARTRRVANSFRPEHRLPDGLFAFHGGLRRTSPNRKGRLRPRKIDNAAGGDMAFCLQASHDLRRQDDDVRPLAGPHQFRRLHAAQGPDLDPNLV